MIAFVRRVPSGVFLLLAGAFLIGGLAADSFFRRLRDAPPPARVVRPACDPAAVPTGTIFFVYEDQVMAMHADGSGKTPLSLDPDGAPSSLVYGDDPFRDRWWLCIQEVGRRYVSPNDTNAELFACRLDPQAPGGVRRIRLTELFASVMVSANAFPPQWSNDGKDSFISFYGADISHLVQEQPDGTATADFTFLKPRQLYKLPVSGAELDAAVRAGTWTPLTADKLEDWGPAPLAVHWSPRGDRFVTYAGDDGGRLLVVSPEGAEVLYDTSQGAPAWMRGRMESTRWSPDGRTILVTSGAGWTIGAAPDCAPLRLAEDEWLFGPCTWSPDGNCVIGRRPLTRRSAGTELVRWRSDGSQPTVLTGDLDPSQVESILGWVGNRRAAAVPGRQKD